MSRAYYAMFHAAHALVARKGDPPRTHRGLLHVLSQEFTGPDLLSREDLGRFSEAQRMREMSDYDPSYEPTGDDAAGLVEDAEAFLERVETILGRRD